MVAAASGDYRLEIRPLEKAAKPGGYQVKIEELLTADQYAERLAAEKAQTEEVKKWLANNAIRLKGVEAGQGFEDMQPLKKVIGEARLVALGEATHGTREFFQLKHRMLEFLVTEMGFTVFGIEATMPEAFDVNEFVLNGKGDPAGALAGLYFWTWDTEEVLDMIRWMRNYNADPHHEKKVKFYGFDAQVPGPRGQGGAGLRFPGSVPSFRPGRRRPSRLWPTRSSRGRTSHSRRRGNRRRRRGAGAPGPAGPAENGLRQADRRGRVGRRAAARSGPGPVPRHE